MKISGFHEAIFKFFHFDTLNIGGSDRVPPTQPRYCAGNFL